MPDYEVTFGSFQMTDMDSPEAAAVRSLADLLDIAGDGEAEISVQPLTITGAPDGDPVPFKLKFGGDGVNVETETTATFV